ncbi:alpha/beta hydrolase [Actinoalloteichus hymeniacidonis]|uniref:Lysophospholipase n=1 Tax=Actinoalloteichus hymeniacidonis TaxID=340345 RepID=A0AAC9MZI9_9PSEU|nr:lysophospholipase [Actinoalloteichus hymeniacidonis]AOS64127.1 lysophospholipase [Actinoalloteichus hymeniacidonis]MBB5907809.1 alpha-beta hydrolase superfamily lysophospholipase [Actinoalloteichus hymeniacidonis]
MTIAEAAPLTATWPEPTGIALRGTVIIVPGRGEHPGVYERFGRRISADGYRVWAVADPTVDADRATRQLDTLIANDALPRPLVLVGSDTGALFAAASLADRTAPGATSISGLVLAGLPSRAEYWADTADWQDELDARTGCPTHQGVLDLDPSVRRGALGRRAPAEWFDRADPASITVPILGLHGESDMISPFAGVRGWYDAAPHADLVGLVGGRHDALNDQTHRSAAATTVLFLERLRLGSELPVIARPASAVAE